MIHFFYINMLFSLISRWTYKGSCRTIEKNKDSLSMCRWHNEAIIFMIYIWSVQQLLILLKHGKVPSIFYNTSINKRHFPSWMLSTAQLPHTNHVWWAWPGRMGKYLIEMQTITWNWSKQSNQTHHRYLLVNMNNNIINILLGNHINRNWMT